MEYLIHCSNKNSEARQTFSTVVFIEKISWLLRDILTMICQLGLCVSLYAQGNTIQDRTADDRLRTLSERQQAVHSLLATATEQRNSGHQAEAARILNRVGHLQLRLNLPASALAAYREASMQAVVAKDTAVRVDALNGLATVYAYLNRCETAESLLGQALPLSKSYRYHAGTAESLLLLSDCQNHTDHSLALRTAQDSLTLWQSEGHKSGMARTYLAIGDYQLAQNELTTAERSYQAAAELWQQLDIPTEQAEALIGLAFVEYRRGSWQDSMSLLTQAQTMLDEAAEPFKLGQINASLGEAFIESGLPDAAVSKLNQAAEYFRQSKNPLSEIVVTWDLGRAYYYLDKYPEALDSLQSGLSRARSIKEDALAAMCHDFIGRTYAAMNDNANALRHLNIADTMYRNVHDPMESARTRALIAQVYEQDGKVENAKAYYLSALEKFDALSDRINQSATLYALGRLELEQNDFNAAELHLAQSIALTEDMRRVSTSRDLTAAFSATVHDRYESYIECLMRKDQAQPQLGFATKAFETSETARARSLIELLHDTQTNLIAGLDSQLAQQEKIVRQSLRVKADSKVALLSTGYKKEDLQTLDNELQQLEWDYRQIIETIRQRYPSYQQIERPPGGNLQQIQERVLADENTLLLEYALGRERSYLWAVTRTAIFSYQLGPRVQIEEAAKRLQKLLTANQTVAGETFEQHQNRIAEVNARMAEESASLSKIVLGPVLDKLAKKRLLIVADGALQYIPFQALTVPANPINDGADQWIPLMVDHEIVNEPSASTLALVLAERAQRKPATNTVAVFSNPVFESDDPRVARNGSSLKANYDASANTSGLLAYVHEVFRDAAIGDGQRIPPLPASREEAEGILSLVPGRSALSAQGFDASRETVSRTDFGSFQVIHFATHGFVDYKHPELSGLVLSLVDQKGQAQDGFLRLRDIYNLKLPVDLVVLSACNTGLGKEVKGEGLIGLTRGFMYAGAGGVAASLWKVDDEATAELMKHFYDGMFSKGLTPAAALREAQVAMWQQKRWHEPYYWAAFVLQGEYNQKLTPVSHFTRTMESLSVTAFVVAALLIASVFYLRRRRNRPV